jgi:hypothetical protein
MLPSKPPSIDERRNPPLIFCGDELNFPFPGLRCGCRRSTRRDSQRLLPFLWHARPPLFIYTRASLSAPPCPVRKQFPGPHSSSTLRAPTTIFADSRCTMRCFDCSPLTFSAELAADLRCEDGEPRVACPCRAAVDWILFEPNAVDSVGDAYRQPAGRFRQLGAKFQRKEGKKHWVVVVRISVAVVAWPSQLPVWAEPQSLSVFENGPVPPPPARSAPPIRNPLRSPSQYRSRPDPSSSGRGAMTGAAPQAYGEAWYWDERYRKEAGPFDWYQRYPALAPLLGVYVARRQRLLLVGCGNSGESGRVESRGWVSLGLFARRVMGGYRNFDDLCVVYCP